jgi:hypothetical protein
MEEDGKGYHFDADEQGFNAEVHVRPGQLRGLFEDVLGAEDLEDNLIMIDQIMLSHGWKSTLDVPFG